MAEFNAEVFCTKLYENVKSNQHRLDTLEKRADEQEKREVTVYEMLAAIKEIAVEMKNMKESQEEIKRNQEKSQEEIKRNQEKSQEEFKKSQDEIIKQIREIEKKPDQRSAKNWDKAIGALISGTVAYLVTEVFK